MNINELSGILEKIQDVTREEAMAIGEAVNQRMRILARFRQAEASVGFRVGDRVQFEAGRGEHRGWIRGTIVRMNRKTAQVAEEQSTFPGRVWNVAYSLLMKQEA